MSIKWFPKVDTSYVNYKKCYVIEIIRKLFVRYPFTFISLIEKITKPESVKQDSDGF